MGGALGAGSYFAENSSYSDAYSRMPAHAHPPGQRAPMQYAYAGRGGRGGYHAAQPPVAEQQDVTNVLETLNPPPGQLLMICARVSLGKVGPAVAQGRMAPPGFQSVGNGGTASQIYAVFDNFQAYPEWVVVYDPTRVGGNGNNGQGAAYVAPLPPGVPSYAGMFGAAAASIYGMAAMLPQAAAPRRRRR